MKINIKKKLKSAGSTIKEMGSINKKSLKNGSYSMAVTAIVIAVLVVVNLIVGQIPEKYTQVDVSTQKLYTISDETVSYLKNLDTDITIYHIVQSGNEDSILEKKIFTRRCGKNFFTRLQWKRGRIRSAREICFRYVTENM